MTIVAFLQCQWFKLESVDRICRIYADATPEHRAKLNARYLFYKSLTGRRLNAAFGEDLCGQIIWEEVSKEIATEASGCFKPDYQHIKSVLDYFGPQVILTFGKVATEAIEKFYVGSIHPMILDGPHPAARHGSVPIELRNMRMAIVDAMAARSDL